MKRLLPLILALIPAISCSGRNADADRSGSFRVVISHCEHDASSAVESVRVLCAGEWTLFINYLDGADWAALSSYSGNGDCGGIILSCTPNASGCDRALEVVISNGERSASAYFVQRWQQFKGYHPDIPGKWMELPSTGESDNLEFYFHTMTLGGERTRNYSFYWDKGNFVSRWVAYPLNAWTVSAGGRTDAWGLDPKLPEDAQPLLLRSYGGGYDRGHQIPSADRLHRSANLQTFYGVNITPQNSEFNQNIWERLERKTRAWSRSFDTLYVVTGCCVEGSDKVAYDNRGHACTVPTAYYKALLGYRKDGRTGLSGVQGGYTAIGFYFPHEPFSGDVLEKSMTVRELEKLTGVDFFVNLPPAESERIETTMDDWWRTGRN